MASTSAASRRRRRAERMFKRAVRRIRRFFASYVSPLGWAVTGAGIACLIAFPFLGWYELLVFGIVAMVMMLAAIALSLGNTRFHASIAVSNHRVTVGDTVSVYRRHRQHRQNADDHTHGGYLPIGDAHERFNIPMLAPRGNPSKPMWSSVPYRAQYCPSAHCASARETRSVWCVTKRSWPTASPYSSTLVPCVSIPECRRARDLEGQPSGQIVDDDLDFYGLREYEPGDDVRNVHWLSSAKTGTLMIRQYEATRRTDTSVTISVNPDEYVNGEEFEMAVSIHSSIGVKCLLQDRPLFCHAGNAHGQPRNAMEFLDNASAIEPDREDNPNLAEGTLKHSPDASFYFFTVGSLKDIEQIKRMTLALPRSASCVVLQASAGANRGIRRFANFTLATIGELDDLPLIMGVLA